MTVLQLDGVAFSYGGVRLFENIDLSVNQGERIGIEVRYVLGLSDITESSDSDESAKNRIWEIVGTYELPIGR